MAEKAMQDTRPRRAVTSRAELEALVPAGDAEYEVVVCGGGPAGIGAALTAAGMGARTLLLEARSVLGGVAGISLQMSFNHLLQTGRLPAGAKPRKLPGVRGLFADKILGLGPQAWRYCNSITSYYHGGLHIHPDYLQLGIFELLEENGCHYSLGTPVTGAIMEGQRIVGVVATGKSGPHKFRGHTIIDCTGDADVAWLAGAETITGREADGRTLLPVTLAFAVGNTDYSKFQAFKPGKHKKPVNIAGWSDKDIEDYYEKNKGNTTEADDPFLAILAYAAKKGYCTAAWYGVGPTTIPGVITVNSANFVGLGDVNGTRARDLTIAKRFGLQVAVDFVKIAREYGIPGLENCFLYAVGPEVAVRHSRRIVGEYVITREDMIRAPDFEDIVLRCPGGCIDMVLVHGIADMNPGIPYRSMVPKKIDGLLAAGRCLSSEYGILRGGGQGTSMGLGQAAAVAAVHCCKSGVVPREVDIAAVRKTLTDMGENLAHSDLEPWY
jgi:hypothetical protein